jgi:YidC/Oxa1 family membrane protein insertase
VIASLPRGTKIGVGDSANINLHTKDGRPFSDVLKGLENPERFLPSWSVTKGEGVVSISRDGSVTALTPGDATVEAKIPGLAARSGFLFIKALGQVGFYADGAINWDIAILVGGFGVTLFVSQLLSGMGMPANPQQSTANKITPVMITGMFLFFPLPAGVLLYMLIANIFQGLQTFILAKEPLPDNLQKILEQQMAAMRGFLLNPRAASDPGARARGPAGAPRSGSSPELARGRTSGGHAISDTGPRASDGRASRQCAGGGRGTRHHRHPDL